MNDENTLLGHEGRISKLEEAMHQVCANHIPHIHEEMKAIRSLLTGLLIGVILAALGIIADLLLRG